MKCKFIFFIGIICVYFLLVVLFLILNIGFRDGFFKVINIFLFSLVNVLVIFIVVVVFFLFVGVGFIVVVSINLVFLLVFFFSRL